MKTISPKQLEKLYMIKEFREVDKHSGTTMMKFEKKDLIDGIFEEKLDENNSRPAYFKEQSCYYINYEDMPERLYIHIELVNMYVKDIVFDTKYLNEIIKNIITKKSLHNINTGITVVIEMKFCVFNNCTFDMDFKSIFENISIETIELTASEMQNCVFKNCSSNSCINLFSFYKSVYYNCTFENVSIRWDFYYSQSLYGKTTFIKSAEMVKSTIFDQAFIYDNLHTNDKFGKIDSVDFEFIDCPNVAFNSLCPKEGEFDVYKIVGLMPRKENAHIISILNDIWPVILKLHVPATAKRSSAFTNKCRVSEAIPIEIIPITKHLENKIHDSLHNQFPDYKGNCFDNGFLQSEFAIKNNLGLYSYFSMGYEEIHYKIGELIKVKNFDERPYIQCSKGIHCFMSIKDVKEWYGAIQDATMVIRGVYNGCRS